VVGAGGRKMDRVWKRWKGDVEGIEGGGRGEGRGIGLGTLRSCT